MDLIYKCVKEKITNVQNLPVFLAVLCLVSFGSNVTYAQNPANGIEASGLHVSENARVVTVEPDDFPMEIGRLNTAIETENDGNTIFELRRDAVYWTYPRIENPDHRLHIRAEEGDGHPPIIRSATDFGQSDYNLYTTRDVIIEGVFFVGLNEMGVQQDQMRHLGSDAVVVFDNIWIFGAHANPLWIEGSNNAIYTTNSMIANTGRNGNDQNGRFIETLGNDQDTIYVENSTMYNLGHAVIRNSGGITGHLYFNHNTVMNITQYFRVGEAQEFVLKNNIFRNIYTIGETLDNQDRAFVEVREQPAGFDENERVMKVNYNNIGYLDEEFVQLIEWRNDHHTDVDIAKAPLISRKYMDPENDFPMVEFENNIEERVDFTDPPDLGPYLDWQRHWMHGRDNIPMDNPPIEEYDHPILYDRWNDTSDDPAPAHYTLDLARSFGYSNELESFTAAENGFPVGDLNWFPELKEKWVAGDTPTSVEEETEVVAEDFRIVGNYPNPFNPSTSIVFELASQVEVTLEVFNVLGQRVEIMELGTHASGRHEVTFDASGLPSGVYVLRMQMGEEVKTQNITLLK